MLFRGELDGFLVVVDANLRVVIFMATIDSHHAAGIAGLDKTHTAGGIIIIGVFELRFVIVNEADGFVMADKLDILASSVAGDGVEVKVWRRGSKTVMDAVFEPVAFPTIVPALDEKPGNAEADGGIDIFHSVLRGGTVSFARRPSPFANIHGPPDTDELQSMHP